MVARQNAEDISSLLLLLTNKIKTLSDPLDPANNIIQPNQLPGQPIFQLNAVDGTTFEVPPNIEYYGKQGTPADPINGGPDRLAPTDAGLTGIKNFAADPNIPYTLNSNYVNLETTLLANPANPVELKDMTRNLNANVPADIITINNRLMNCQNLEFLYLKKHEEIMKIFAFTLNLFDKYKYSVKVMLYLLKNLAYKTPVAGNINLPKTIIPNIKKLLIDQEKIQGVINSMKQVIVDANVSYLPDMAGNASATDFSQKLKTATANPLNPYMPGVVNARDINALDLPLAPP